MSRSLHDAASAGDVEELRRLLGSCDSAELSRFDERSHTPLIAAVEAGNEEAVRLLLDAGSDVNAHEEARIGDTALLKAVNGKDLALVELLLAYGADPTIPGWMGLSPLAKARAWRNSTRHPELRRMCEVLEAATRRPRR